MTKTENWQSIRIFLSSTFLDLEGIRDQIGQSFSTLESQFREQQTHLQLYDLRWQDCPEETDLVDWCLSIVKQCQYFICVVGQRYGWRPPCGSDHLENVANYSITELEIRQALQIIPKPHRKFYFPEKFSCPSVDDEQALEKLKLFLTQQEEDISYYTNESSLPGDILRDLQAMIDLGCHTKSEENSIQDVFIGRQKEKQAIEKFLNDSSNSMLIVLGEAGIGKSALLYEVSKEQTSKQLFYSTNTQARRQNTREVLFHLGEQLRELGLLNISTTEEKHLQIEQIYNAICKAKFPLQIFIDGLDELEDEGADFAWLLRSFPSQVKFVISSRQTEVIDAWSGEKLVLTPLAKEDMKALIRAVSREKLSTKKRKALQNKAQGNPLYLKIVLERSLSSRDIAKLSLNIEGLFDQIYEELQEKIPKTADILGLLLTSYQGVYPEEIASILELPEETLVVVKNSFRHFLEVQNGRWFIFHPQFGRRLLRQIGKSKKREYHTLWVEFFRGSKSLRCVEELPYQLQQSFQYSELLKCLTDIDFIERKAQSNFRDLYHDYDYAIEDNETKVPADLEIEVAYGVWANVQVLISIRSIWELHFQFILENAKEVFSVLWNLGYWHYSETMREIVENWRFQQGKIEDSSWLRSQIPLPGKMDPSVYKVLKGHLQAIFSLAIHPEGELIASGSRDGQIFVWDVEKSSYLWTIQNSSSITELCWIGSDFLLSSSIDGLVCLYTRDGDLQNSWQFTQPVHAITYSHKHDTIFIAEWNKIYCWQLENPLPKVFAEHSDSVWSLQCDGDILISGAYDAEVKIWNIVNVECLHSLPQGEKVFAVAYHREQDILAVATTRQLILWQPHTGKKVKVLHDGQQQNRICCLTFSPCGEKLAAGSYDRKVLVWNWKSSLQPFCSRESHLAAVYAVDFFASDTIISASYDRTIQLAKIVETPALPEKAQYHSEWIQHFSMNSSQTYLASATHSELVLWQLQTMQRQNSMNFTNEIISQLKFGKHHLWVSFQEGRVFCWDVFLGKYQVFREDIYPLDIFEVSPEESYMALAGEGQVVVRSFPKEQWIKVWNYKNNEMGLVSSIAFSPDEQWLAFGDNLGKIGLYQLQEKKFYGLWQAHDHTISGLSFSSDGKLASCSYDKKVKTWQINPWCLEQELACNSELFNAKWNAEELLIYAREGQIITWNEKGVFALNGRAPLERFQKSEGLWGLVTKQQTQIFLSDTKVSTFPEPLAGLYPVGKDGLVGYRGRQIYFLKRQTSGYFIPRYL